MTIGEFDRAVSFCKRSNRTGNIAWIKRMALENIGIVLGQAQGLNGNGHRNRVVMRTDHGLPIPWLKNPQRTDQDDAETPPVRFAPPEPVKATASSQTTSNGSILRTEGTEAKQDMALDKMSLDQKIAMIVARYKTMSVQAAGSIFDLKIAETRAILRRNGVEIRGRGKAHPILKEPIPAEKLAELQKLYKTMSAPEAGKKLGLSSKEAKQALLGSGVKLRKGRPPAEAPKLDEAQICSVKERYRTMSAAEAGRPFGLSGRTQRSC